MSRHVSQFANSMIQLLGVTKTEFHSARNRPSLKKPMRSKPNLGKGFLTCVVERLAVVICPGDWVAICKLNSMDWWNVTIGWFDDFCCFHLDPSKHLYKNPEMPTTTGPVGQPHGAPVVPNFQKLPANVETEVETKWGHHYVVGPPSAPLFHLSKKTRGGSGIHEPCWRPHACHAAWRKVRISPYKFSWMTWNDTKGVQIVELFWTHHSHIGRQECVRQSNQPCLSCLWKGISMHIMHLLLEIHWPFKVEGYFANAAGLSLPPRFEAFSLPWSIQPELTTLHLSLQTWLWDLKNLQNQMILLPFAFWKLRC